MQNRTLLGALCDIRKIPPCVIDDWPASRFLGIETEKMTDNISGLGCILQRKDTVV